MKVYKIEDGITYIRMLPNISKYRKSLKNYRDIIFIYVKIGKELVRFYTDDNNLNLAFHKDRYKKIGNGGHYITPKAIFYGLIDGKVELVSITPRIFNRVITDLTKEIGNGKDPLDPRSGVGIKINMETLNHTNNNLTELPTVEGSLLNNLIPISIGDSSEECIDFILNRDVDMDDYLYDLNLLTHPRRKEIHDYINNNKDLSNWKSDFRENRLESILGKLNENGCDN